jgi:hypothetical protein
MSKQTKRMTKEEADAYLAERSDEAWAQRQQSPEWQAWLNPLAGKSYNRPADGPLFTHMGQRWQERGGDA